MPLNHAGIVLSESMKEEIVRLLPRLRRFALALTGCPDLGEELTQETCLKALAKSSQWRPGTRLDSWLFRIAQNGWIDGWRARRRFGEAEALDEQPLADATSAELSAFSRHRDLAVRRAVAALPPEQRAVVALVCVEGYAYREAAEILAIPIGTVMSRLARARQTLHEALYGRDEDWAQEKKSHA
jgi:RNA polymerase sigma-70 factor (ECF subfamily)